LTNHPDTPPPDPAALPPSSPDGTGAPDANAGTPAGGSAPISGQPWSTPSGDPLSPEPYRPPAPASYRPGSAAIPEPEPDYPPTSQFPAQPPVNYAPPGYAPDFGHGGAGTPPPGYAPPPGYGQPPGYAQMPGYAQTPGYEQPPGYGQPGYGQPGYEQHPGYLPPQPPPKRSNAPIIAVIIAVTVLLCGGLATAGVLIAQNATNKAKEVAKPYTNLPTEVPEVPNLPDDPQAQRKITVTYEVTGDGPASIAYIDEIDQAPVRKTEVQLPWKFTTTMETPALLSVVAVRIGTTEGTVTCRALVDGAEVKKSTSNKGTVATASCIHLAFE
jgi:hypothetical protein